MAASLVVKCQQWLPKAAWYSNEPVVFAVARYSNRVVIARAQRMPAEYAFVIEKARSSNVH